MREALYSLFKACVRDEAEVCEMNTRTHTPSRRNFKQHKICTDKNWIRSSTINRI